MNNNELRDRLLELEPYPEDLRNSVREVIHLRERPLKVWERPLGVFVCVLLGMMLIGAVVGLVAFFDTIISRVPMYILIALPFGVLLLGWLLVAVLLSLKRGTCRLRDDQFGVYAGAAFVLYISVGDMIVESVTHRHMDAADLVALIVFAVLVVVVRIQEAEVGLREHALRNELALAKLTELIAGRTGVDLK